MRITLIGHATLVVESAGETILVDPLLGRSFASGAIGFFPDRHLELEKMPRPTAIVVTHSHIDHYDAPSLALLPKQVPVLIPPDDWLEAQLRHLGFQSIARLEPWAQHQRGALKMTAIPSHLKWPELGIVFDDGAARFWDVSDCLVDPELGERVRREFGPIDVVAAKFQPGNVLVGYQRNLGTSFDEKAEVVRWLEAAARAEPRYVFPWAFGVRYRGEHRWANRYAFPFEPRHAAELLARRLGDQERTGTVLPGDVIEVEGGAVTHHRQRSGFVRHRPRTPPVWEPVEPGTLPGLKKGPLRAELVERLEQFLAGPYTEWLGRSLAPEGPLADFPRGDVVWQLVVHLGKKKRLYYGFDFRKRGASIERGQLPDANYFAHLSGKSLLRVLRGEAGNELFWIAGDYRVAERILTLREGKVWYPPLQGWSLFEVLPEPLTLCLRWLYPSGQLTPHVVET
ncbi:MAG: MBL fold metallo-hydrolase [Myxococcota bacterium]